MLCVADPRQCGLAGRTTVLESLINLNLHGITFPTWQYISKETNKSSTSVIQGPNSNGMVICKLHQFYKPQTNGNEYLPGCVFIMFNSMNL